MYIDTFGSVCVGDANDNNNNNNNIISLISIERWVSLGMTSWADSKDRSCLVQC